MFGVIVLVLLLFFLHFIVDPVYKREISRPHDSVGGATHGEEGVSWAQRGSKSSKGYEPARCIFENKR